MFIVIHIDNNSHFVDVIDYKTQEEATSAYDGFCDDFEDEGDAMGSVHLYEVLPEAYQFKMDECKSHMRQLQYKEWDCGESYDDSSAPDPDMERYFESGDALDADVDDNGDEEEGMD